MTTSGSKEEFSTGSMGERSYKNYGIDQDLSPNKEKDAISGFP